MAIGLTILSSTTKYVGYGQKQHITTALLSGGASYTTGGEALTAAALTTALSTYVGDTVTVSTIIGVTSGTSQDGVIAYSWTPDSGNTGDGKLLAFDAPATEMDAATNLSATAKSYHAVIIHE